MELSHTTYDTMTYIHTEFRPNLKGSSLFCVDLARNYLAVQNNDLLRVCHERLSDTQGFGHNNFQQSIDIHVATDY